MRLVVSVCVCMCVCVYACDKKFTCLVLAAIVPCCLKNSAVTRTVSYTILDHGIYKLPKWFSLLGRRWNFVLWYITPHC